MLSKKSASSLLVLFKYLTSKIIWIIKRAIWFIIKNAFWVGNEKVIKINDPSWILSGGGGGVFRDGKDGRKEGSWYKKANKVKDKEVIELVKIRRLFLS